MGKALIALLILEYINTVIKFFNTGSNRSLKGIDKYKSFILCASNIMS